MNIRPLCGLSACARPDPSRGCGMPPCGLEKIRQHGGAQFFHACKDPRGGDGHRVALVERRAHDNRIEIDAEAEKHLLFYTKRREAPGGVFLDIREPQSRFSYLFKSHSAITLWSEHESRSRSRPSGAVQTSRAGAPAVEVRGSFVVLVRLFINSRAGASPADGNGRAGRPAR